MTLPEAEFLWRGQSAPSSHDAAALAERVRREARAFDRRILWRDVTEIAASLLVAGVFAVSGLRSGAPLAWPIATGLFALVPAAFLIAGRIRRLRHAPAASAALRDHITAALDALDVQIRLLSTVAWWYLAPLGVAALLFLGGAFFQPNSPVPWPAMVVGLLGAAIALSVVWVWVYRLNQRAVTRGLEPRRRDLAETLTQLA
ncbi:MAG: hypothetical protein HYV96_08700 [Opitutae bacterium]|nr:hypothetical protein [Opitutae bacterium]